MEFAHQAQNPVPTECPAPVLIVTTTTVDVTVYVTPEPTEEPCDDDDMTQTVTENHNTTVTETPCDETVTPTAQTTTKIWHVNSTITEEPCDEETPHITTQVYNMTVPEPCDDDTMVTATATSTMRHWQKVNVTMPGTPTGMPMSTSQLNTTTSATTTEAETETPCEETETPTTNPCDEGEIFVPFTNTSMTAAPTQTPQTTDCIIDTSISPVSTSTMTATVTMTAMPTKTQCVHDEPTGKPADDSMYCGIHGKPAGTYFIAEFIENKPDEPVTEEGCYQFCDVSDIHSILPKDADDANQTLLQSVMESTKGCQSYRFYKNQLGAPRCSLYGHGVAKSVDDLDKNQPDVWYDLSCGSPTQEKWHQNMPADHGKPAPSGKKARSFFF